MLLALGALGLVVVPRPRLGAAGRALALAGAFAALGYHALALRLETASASPAQGEHLVEARVSRAERVGSEGQGGWRISLDAVRALGADPVAVPARITLSAWEGEPGSERVAALHPGDRLRALLRLTPATGRANPGNRNAYRAEERRGIGARAQLVHPALLYRAEGASDDPLAPLRRWRAALVERLLAHGRGGALLAALALGEGGAISPADRDAAARLGIAHLLAVSGLHVAFVLGGAYALCRRALLHVAPLARQRDPRPPALWAALAMAAGYAALAGGRAPVLRAFVLAACAVAGFALGRRRSSVESLSAAVLVVLATDPAGLFEPGAQLSFAACAGLLAARPLGSRTADQGSRLAALAISLRRVAGHTAVAVSATAPVLAAHGAAASPWALGANLLAVPWCGVALLPLAFCAVLAASLAPSHAGAASGHWLDLAARLAEAHLDAALAIAQRLPGPDDVGFGSLAPRAGWAIALALVAVVAVTRARRLGTRVFLCAAVLAWLRLAPAARIEPGPPRLVALDVGQGDALLVQGRRGSLLVDAGGALPGRWDAGRAVVLPALRALGLRRLDVLVVSHADLDHRGGAPALIDHLEVGELWLPAAAADEPELRALARRARVRGTRVALRAAGEPRLEVGDLSVRVLWPGRSAVGPRNERSLVLSVEVDGARILLTGDAGFETERALLRAGERLTADVLKVGHHGSAGSSGARFLAAVGPRIALVSARCPAGSGLPSPSTLRRLATSGAELGWTGRDGALLVGLGRHPQLLRQRAHPICSAEAPALPASRPFGANLERHVPVGVDPQLGGSEPDRVGGVPQLVGGERRVETRPQELLLGGARLRRVQADELHGPLRRLGPPEVANQERSARSQHTGCLGEERSRIRKVVEHRVAEDAVEVRVGAGQVAHVPAFEAQARRQLGVAGRACPGELQHGAGEIHAQHLDVRPPLAEEDRDLAGAGAEVQVAPPDSQGDQPLDEGLVHGAVVHGVVLAGFVRVVHHLGLELTLHGRVPGAGPSLSVPRAGSDRRAAPPGRDPGGSCDRRPHRCTGP